MFSDTRSNTFDHILLLEANTKSTSPEMAREVSRTAAELAKIASKHSLPLSAVDARSLLYSIQCNAHQIVSTQSGAAGIALRVSGADHRGGHSQWRAAGYFVAGANSEDAAAGVG